MLDLNSVNQLASANTRILTQLLSRMTYYSSLLLPTWSLYNCRHRKLYLKSKRIYKNLKTY